MMFAQLCFTRTPSSSWSHGRKVQQQTPGAYNVQLRSTGWSVFVALCLGDTATQGRNLPVPFGGHTLCPYLVRSVRKQLFFPLLLLPLSLSLKDLICLALALPIARRSLKRKLHLLYILFHPLINNTGGLGGKSEKSNL